MDKIKRKKTEEYIKTYTFRLLDLACLQKKQKIIKKIISHMLSQSVKMLFKLSFDMSYSSSSIRFKCHKLTKMAWLKFFLNLN